MESINTLLFRQMIESGANNLANQHQEINALNVFPVPDGDTGTNMNLTFTNGNTDVKKSLSTSVGELSKVLSKGLLMGARGNSGVILSQIFRGFATSVEGKESISTLDLAEGFMKGKEVAYKAVMRPVEGTILTVLRESSQAAYDYVQLHPETSIETYFVELIKEAEVSLAHTPELLPVLKEVGVVDSGGAGFVAVIKGFEAAIAGQGIQRHADSDIEVSAGATMDHDEFGYCTEFIVRLNQNVQHVFKENLFKKSLARLGNSIVVVQDDDLLKVHVHTLKPGDALNLGQRYGEFIKLKIENMSEQHSHLNDIVDTGERDIPRKAIGLIAVAAGPGLKQAFEELRVDVVISGGQTMNPSTEDFVAAIKRVNADHVILLPNNSNIILAAQQASSLVEDKTIHVLESKSIPQGLSACVMYNPDLAIDENLSEMQSALANTKTGEITYAIKDTTFDDVEIKEGDYMGIFGKSIIVSTPSKLEAAKATVDAMVTPESELLTLIRGEDASEEEVSELETYIDDKFDIEVERIEGLQPVYSFIIGVE